MDNTDPEITFHNDTEWTHDLEGIMDYGGSLSNTSTPGGWLSYSFDGVAIWYDYVSHTIQQPTSSVGITVVGAITAATSAYRLMVRHLSGPGNQPSGH